MFVARDYFCHEDTSLRSYYMHVDFPLNLSIREILDKERHVSCAAVLSSVSNDRIYESSKTCGRNFFITPPAMKEIPRKNTFSIKSADCCRKTFIKFEV